MKYCKDCKFYAKRNFLALFDRICCHPRYKEIDLVSGKEINWYPYCSNNRMVNGDCEPEAKLYEPK